MSKIRPVAVFLIFILLALVWTYPLIRHIGQAIPYTVLPETGLEIVPLYPGDHLQFYYRLWLFYDSLKQGEPISGTTYEFNENMGKRTIAGRYFPLSLIYALLAPFGGPLAYNVLLLLTFPLMGLFTYLAVRSFGGGFWGGLAGGVVGAFLPYRVGQLAGGHPNAFVFFIIPLMIWLTEEHFRTGSKRMAWLAGLVFFFQMIMELHAAFYTVILMAVYVPLRIFLPVTNWLSVENFQKGTGGGPPLPWINVLPSAAVFSFRLLQTQITGQEGQLWPTAVVSAIIWALSAFFLQGVLSASIASVFRTDRLEAAALAGRIFMPLFILPLYAIRYLYPVPFLGRGLMAAAALAVVVGAARHLYRLAVLRHLRADAAVPIARIRGLALPIVLSLGASLAWLFYLKESLFSGTSIVGGRSAGEAMLFTPELADAVRRINPSVEFYLYPGVVCALIVAAGVLVMLRGRGKGPVWPLFFFGGLAALSYLLCFGSRGDVLIPLSALVKRIPYMSYGRVPSRAVILFAPAFSILVGLSLGRLTSSTRARVTAIIIGAAALLGILADFWPSSATGLTRMPEGNNVYEDGRVSGDPGKIVEIPIWPGDSAWSSVYQYWVTRYRHGIINGYSPVVPPGYYEQVFWPLAGLNVGYLEERESSVLRDLGVDRLILHEEVFPPKVSLFPFGLTLKGLQSSPYLRYRRRDGWLWLFEVLDEPRAGPSGTPVYTSPKGVVFQAESASMNPARIRDITGGRAAAGAGPEIPVISGPFRLFPPGRFRARLRMRRSEEAGWENLSLRLSDESGESLDYTLRILPAGGGGWRDVDLVFETKRPRRIGVVLYQTAGIEVDVDYLYIVYDDQTDPPRSAEFEDLPHAGRIVEDEGASGGRAVLLDAGVDPAMAFNMGPGRLLPEGRWMVGVRYSTGGDDSGEDKVVIREHAGSRLGEIGLPPVCAGLYDEASAVIDLEKPAFFDLEIRYSGKADLMLDRIEVSRK